MRLDQFIEATLSEIAMGVSKARVKSKDLVSIAPAKIDGKSYHTESNVNFDVTLSVTSGSEHNLVGGVKGSAKMRIVVVDADMALGAQKNKKNTDTQESTHRVSFSVPIVLTADHRNDPSMDENARVIADVSSRWGD